jgi:hypothetical protein
MVHSSRALYHRAPILRSAKQVFFIDLCTFTFLNV